MASNTASFKLTLDDGGTIKSATNSTKELNKELAKAQTSASRAAGATAVLAAAKKRSEGQEYGTSRGAIGTGAEARDFAKQSQGLGGLVRVYATFAANIFAVSAAFNALKAAADTTNMVKGLDQLGAASGRNLGTLAKDIVKVTDNAVSLREAMTATAQASAAGMSNKDILRMAEGAKKASQALGIDMSDALSRISRGITKLEPELLDEIGIFIRVDRASQEFAKSIGKPVSALSDLEKRSAFAAAALKQVETKFGSIDIDSNPYTQLAASFKNVASSGGEMINNVLGPLVKLLAQSPTALGLTISGIAFTLLNQAMPAITSFRQNLRDAADETARSAQETEKNFRAMREISATQMATKLRQAVKAQADVSDAAMKAATDTLDRGFKIGASTITKLGEKFKQGIVEDADLAKALKQADRFQVGAENTSNSYTPERRKGDMDKAAAIRTYVNELRIAKVAREDLNKAEIAAQNSLSKKAGAFSQESMLTMIRQRTEAASARSSIIANAADNASFIGPINSFKMLRAEISASTVAMSTLGKATTYTRGAIAILGATAATAMSAFAPILMIVSLVTAGAVALVNAFKSNNDEIAATEQAVTRLDESGKGLSRTLTFMSKLDPTERMTSASLTAKANAMGELAQAMSGVVSAAEEEISKRTSFASKATNWFAKAYGGDTETQLAESVAKGLVKAIDMARSSPELVKNLPGLLELAGGSSATTDSISKRLKDTPSLVAKVDAALKQNAASAKYAADANMDLSESLKNISKARTDVLNTYNINDPVSKLGESMILSASKLKDALKGPEDNLQNIIDSAKDLVSTGLFSVEQTSQLNNYSSGLSTMAAQFFTAKTNASELDKKLLDLQTKRDALRMRDGMEINTPTANNQRKVLDSDIAKTQSAIQANNTILANGRKTIDAASGSLSTAVSSVFEKGVGLVARSIDSSFAKAALTIEKARAQGISGTTQGIQVDAAIQKKELDVQIAQISVMQSLIRSIQLNTLATDEQSMQAQLESEKGKGAGASSATIGRIEGLRAQRKVIESKGNTVSVLDSEIKNAVSKEAKDTLLNMLAYSQQQAGLNAQVAGLSAQKKAVDITSGFQQKDKEAADRAKMLADSANSELNAKKAKLALDKDTGVLSEAELIRSQALLDAEQRKIELASTLAGLERARDRAIEASGKDSSATKERERDISNAKELAASAERVATYTASVSAARAEQRTTDSYLAKEAELQAARQQDIYDSVIGEKEASLAILDIENDRNNVSADTYAASAAALKLDILSAKTAKDKLELVTKIGIRQKEIDRKIEAQSADPSTSKSIKEATAQEQRALNDELSRGISLINRTEEAERSAIRATTARSQAMQILDDHIQSSADTLIDAFFDATQSGKYDFTDMVDSMLLDLARLEFKAKMLSMLKGNGEPGSGLLDAITGGLKSLFTGTSSATPPTTTTTDLNTFGSAGTTAFAAKGRAYGADSIQAFAKGGTFTNSVVSSPTLFKFAKGTGLMGEAGPEAIMPLQRDATGRLGVSALGGGSATNVVINNYSGAATETKETVDSRGQRKIEVTIGNMVAGEIQRTGSAAQQSIRGTFGAQPQLVRR